MSTQGTDSDTAKALRRIERYAVYLFLRYTYQPDELNSNSTRCLLCLNEYDELNYEIYGDEPYSDERSDDRFRRWKLHLFNEHMAVINSGEETEDKLYLDWKRLVDMKFAEKNK